MRNFSKLIIIAVVAVSCSEQKTTALQSTISIDTPKIAEKFTAAMVSNKKDFICGMPVTAGITDTAHYKEKIYGFCSAGCREEFLKAPETYIKEKKKKQ